MLNWSGIVGEVAQWLSMLRWALNPVKRFGNVSYYNLVSKSMGCSFTIYQPHSLPAVRFWADRLLRMRRKTRGKGYYVPSSILNA